MIEFEATMEEEEKIEAEADLSHALLQAVENSEIYLGEEDPTDTDEEHFPTTAVN